MSKDLDTFDKWWMMQSKIPYRDKKEIARSAWEQSRTATLEWIAVSERLPEFDLMVLVSCRIYGRYLSSYTEVGDSGFGQWSDHEWNKGALPPTHWMPLPEPPIDNLRGDK